MGHLSNSDSFRLNISSGWKQRAYAIPSRYYEMYDLAYALVDQPSFYFKEFFRYNSMIISSGMLFNFSDRYKVVLFVYHGFFEELINVRRNKAIYKIMNDVKEPWLRKLIMSTRLGGFNMDRIRKNFGLPRTSSSLEENLEIKNKLIRNASSRSKRFKIESFKSNFVEFSFNKIFRNRYFFRFSRFKSIAVDIMSNFEKVLDTEFKRISKKAKIRLIDFFKKRTCSNAITEVTLIDFEPISEKGFRWLSKKLKSRLIEIFNDKNSNVFSMVSQSNIDLNVHKYLDVRGKQIKSFGKNKLFLASFVRRRRKNKKFRFKFYRIPLRLRRISHKIYRYKKVPWGLRNFYNMQRRLLQVKLHDDFRKLFERIGFDFMHKIGKFVEIALKLIPSRLVDSATICRFVRVRLEQFNTFNEIVFPTSRYIREITKFSGFLIRVAGRINRQQRASFNEFKLGSTPFNTFAYPLDFTYDIAILKYGVASIRVWISRGFKVPAGKMPKMYYKFKVI